METTGTPRLSICQRFLNCLTGKRIFVDGRLYMTRWHIRGDGSGKGWELYVHQLQQPDSYRWLHNHPWSWFLTFVISGGYEQEILDLDTNEKRKQRISGFSLFRGQRKYHSIRKLPKGNAWTLVIVPPKNGYIWGYWNEDTNEHVPNESVIDASTYTVEFGPHQTMANHPGQ